MSLLAIRMIRKRIKRHRPHAPREETMATTTKGKNFSSSRASASAKSKDKTEIEDMDPADWAHMPRQAKAEAMVKDHMLVSLGVGLIPFPLVDIAAGITSQVVLVKRLCNLYDLPFSHSAARAAVLSLSSAVSATGTAAIVGFSLGKMIPGIGTAAGLVTLPIANAALTYTIGKLFIGHFEMGGTLFDFDPRSNVDYFRSVYARGKSVATDLAHKVKPGKNEDTADAAEDATAAEDTTDTSGPTPTPA